MTITSETEGMVLVLEKWGCPKCGNRHMDNLVWDNEGITVTCHACGAVYEPDLGAA